MPEPSGAAPTNPLCQEYTVLRCLASRGAIESRQLQHAQDALEALGLGAIENASQDLDIQLLDEARQKNARGAFLCLRCRVSWPLEQRVRALHRQHAKNYGVELLELAAFALDDTGRSLPFHKQEDGSGSARMREPFSVEVIRSYQPELSSLGHWAKLRFEGRNDLKAYLRQQGVRLIGPWALLGDASHRQVREAMTHLGRGPSADEAEALHRRYRPLYRDAKRLYLQRTGRQRGWQPDSAFLTGVAPGQPAAKTREQLEAIAEAVRCLTTGGWQRTETDLLNDAATGSWTEALGVTTPEAADQEFEDLELLSKVLEQVGLAYVTEMLNETPGNDEGQRYWQAWSEGLSTRAIAERCGTNQARVSRHLKTEARASAIATRLLAQLKRDPLLQSHPELRKLFSSLEAQEQAVARVMNHLLNSEQPEGISPFRRWVLEALRTTTNQEESPAAATAGGMA